MSLIKFNLLKQMKTYKFMFVVMISILLGILCVPGRSDGYEILNVGGIRGIYNSAWLGALGAMLTSIILWLPGFYLQRSQITEDKELKIGQIIASTPMSKLRYVVGKFISNLVVLLVLDGLFMISMIAMQLIRQESAIIAFWQYIGPQIMLVIPSLVFCAALSVLFDVLPGMKGAVGNCVVFFLWTFLMVASIELPSSVFDVFGLGFILDGMHKGAIVFYPNIPEGGSFGYYSIKEQYLTFQWDGLNWTNEILVSRVMIIGISLGLVVLTALLFNRFRETAKTKPIGMHQKDTKKLSTLYTTKSFQLSPVIMSKNINFLGLVKGELKLSLYGQPLWWYALVLTGIIVSLFVDFGEGMKWVSVILLLPMALWSQMGSRDTLYGTEELLNYSCSRTDRWLATWLSGLIVSLLMSWGILFRFANASLWSNVIAWSVGIVFIPTMAMTLGSISKSRRLFEVIFITIFYTGPIQEMGKFDFLGVAHNNASFYVIVTVILFAVGYFYQEAKERWLIKTMKNLPIGILVMGLCLGISGCGSTKVDDMTFESKLVNNITIEAEASNINVYRGKSNDIIVKYSGSEVETEIIDNTLEIKIPESKSLINIKIQTLEIEVPDIEFETLLITSAVGKISVSDIRAQSISAINEAGDIETTGISGVIEAKTEVGSIKTNLLNESDMIRNEAGSLAKQLIGQVGEGDSQIYLYSNVGSIVVK